MTRKQWPQLRELMIENGSRFWSRTKHTGKTVRGQMRKHMPITAAAQKAGTEGL